MANKTSPRKRASGFGTFIKRARIWIVTICGVAVICFFLLPLMLNSNYFQIKDQVFAAPPDTPAPTQAAEAAPLFLALPPEIIRESAPTPVPTAAPQIVDIEISYPTLQLDDKHDAVLLLQARLMELGYFDHDGTTDTFGPITQSAVQLFQRAYNMEQTGIADSSLQKLLYSADARPYRMEQGNRGTDVKSMQRRLNELGYYEDKDNGYFGIATEEAVRAFQLKNKIEQTGVVDQAVNDLLFSPKARYKIDPTPSPTPKPTPKPTKTPKISAKPKASKTPAATAPDFSLPQDPGGEEQFPYEPTETPAPTAKPSVPNGYYGTGLGAFLAAANDQLGKPYVLGEEGPDSYDCSGFIYYCLRQAGLSVKRYNAAGFSEVESWRAIYSLNECQQGDLLFYTSDGGSRISHVAIYIGGGRIIHASTSAGKVLISDGTTPYYLRNFVIARRIF